MKRILKFFLGAVIASASIGAAQAQQTGLASQVVLSATKTVDISNARFVSTKAGNQYVIDRLGVKHVGTFPNVAAVTYSQAWRDYVKVGDDLYANMSSVNWVDCVQSNSVVAWRTASSR